MTKKFTEKQFNSLINIQQDYFSTSIFYDSGSYRNGELITTAGKAIGLNDKKIWDFIIENELENEAIALMNPISRPYVKDKLVEKEEKHVWMVDDYQTVSLDYGQWQLDDTPKSSEEYKFTRSEIMDSPFNINKLVKKSEEDDEINIEDDLPF